MRTGPSVLERMAVYERTTGLKPSGAHRRVADELIRRVSRRCTHCAGDGYFLAGKGWLWCEACGGLGRVLTPRAQLVLRQRVVEKYPGARVGQDPEAGWRQDQLSASGDDAMRGSLVTHPPLFVDKDGQALREPAGMWGLAEFLTGVVAVGSIAAGGARGATDEARRCSFQQSSSVKRTGVRLSGTPMHHGSGAEGPRLKG